MKALFEKYREIIIYIIVGLMTTVFCWVFCWILEEFIFDSSNAIQNFLIQTIDWLAGVFFSYPLNRKWVFKSKNPHIVKEFMGFTSSRLLTWGMDALIMFLLVNVWPMTNWINRTAASMGFELTQYMSDKLTFWFPKIFISSVLVTVANYIFSKLLIFKKDKNKENVSEGDAQDVENI